MSGSGSGIARISACVYGCLGSLKICSTVPISTIRPRYMIATRSQKNLALRQVVGDVDVRQPEPVLEVDHQVEDLRPHAHVEHRDRLVGHDQVGADDDRPRDRRALLLAAGEVARQPVRELLDRRQVRPARAPRGPSPWSRRRPWSACGSAAGARARSPASCPGSARRAGPGRPSAGAGAWGAAGARAGRRAPRRAASTLPPVGRTRPSSARPSVVLPEPDSPTRPRTSPSCRSNETPSTAFTAPPAAAREARLEALVQREVDLEVADLHQGLGGVAVALMLPPRRPAPRARAVPPGPRGCLPWRAASTPSGAPGRW